MWVQAVCHVTYRVVAKTNAHESLAHFSNSDAGQEHTSALAHLHTKGTHHLLPGALAAAVRLVALLAFAAGTVFEFPHRIPPAGA